MFRLNEMKKNISADCEYCSAGFARLEKYLNIQDILEKSLKIKIALKST